MKTPLLIMTSFVLVSGCRNKIQNNCFDRVQEYKVLSAKYVKDERFNLRSDQIVVAIKRAESIQGPVIGAIVKEIKLLEIQSNDTILVTVFGDENKLFRIGRCYYESKVPILPINAFR